MNRSHHQTQHRLTQGYKNTYILKWLNIRKYPSSHQALKQVPTVYEILN